METDYSDLDVDQIVKEVYVAEAEGRTRPATKQETMRIRLAALSAIVRNLQDIVEKDHESKYGIRYRFRNPTEKSLEIPRKLG